MAKIIPIQFQKTDILGRHHYQGGQMVRTPTADAKDRYWCIKIGRLEVAPWINHKPWPARKVGDRLTWYDGYTVYESAGAVGTADRIHTDHTVTETEEALIAEIMEGVCI